MLTPDSVQTPFDWQTIEPVLLFSLHKFLKTQDLNYNNKNIPIK